MRISDWSSDVCSSALPRRTICQDDTPSLYGGETNPPLTVYDSSGPYTDPDVRRDFRAGLAQLRQAWIAERGDTKELDGPTSQYGRSRLESPAPESIRLQHQRTPRPARTGKTANQLQYARQGPLTLETECVRSEERRGGKDCV